MRRVIGKTMAVAVALVVTLGSRADAQVCASYPAIPGGFSVGANLASPPDGTTFGVEGSYNFVNPFAAFASFNFVRPDGDTEDYSILGAGASYEITDFVPVIPEWLAVCPVAAVSLSSVDGTSHFTVPLGVGFGTTVPLVNGLDLMPFVIPQFIMTRVAIDDVSIRDHNFGIGFGALARFANIYAGVTAGREFVEAAEIDVAFRAGVTIPSP